MNDEHASSSIQGRAPPPARSRPAVPQPSFRVAAAGDDYEIIREIGRGGMAVVYEAHQKSLHRRVALKQLPAAAALDQRWRERFHLEIRATSHLSHSNIVPFYECGHRDESHYYTMQLIEGISLADVIDRLRQCREGKRPCLNLEAEAIHPAFLTFCGRCECRFACEDAGISLDVRKSERVSKRTDLAAIPSYHRAAVELVRDAALAVHYAHIQGILHLDLKPSNILIDSQGKTWITDFGACRSSEGPAGPEGVSGTLCYMSPEQALGRDGQLDVRSDVYSLGATLYQLLTLKRPFFHTSPHALLTQVSLGRFTPPGEANRAIPPELNTIITRAMARDPEHRHSTACRLADELESCLTAPFKLTVSREERATQRRGGIFAAVFATALLAILFAFAPWRDSFPGPVYEWNGHYYASTEHEKDWDSAETEAVAHGGHLVTINDRQEQEFVVKTFLTPPDRVFWIGMTDQEVEGEWRWVSGEPVEYTNWENPGEPNNVSWPHPVTGQILDEDYGVINWHAIVEPPRRRTCTWNDIDSIPNDASLKWYHGIMEFESDPR